MTNSEKYENNAYYCSGYSAGYKIALNKQIKESFEFRHLLAFTMQMCEISKLWSIEDIQNIAKRTLKEIGE